MHRRIADRAELLSVGAGWHAHLDFLAAVLSQGTVTPFWDAWAELRETYAARLASA